MHSSENIQRLRSRCLRKAETPVDITSKTRSNINRSLGFSWHNSIPLLCTLESTKWGPKASHWFVYALVQHETFCHCPVLQNLNENRLVLSGSWCFSCLAWAEKQICLCPWPSMAQTQAPCLFSAWTCCFATAWNRLLSLRVLSHCNCHHLIKKSQVAYSCQVRHDPTNSNFKLKTPTIIFTCLIAICILPRISSAFAAGVLEVIISTGVSAFPGTTLSLFCAR